MKSEKIVLLLSIPILLIISSNSFKQERLEEGDNGQDLFINHCGSCHLLPKPSSLPKQVWEFRVLPVMAARMGIIYPNYDPLKGLNPEEKEIVNKNYIIPSQPVLNEEDWKKLSNYIIRNAPDQATIDGNRLSRNAPLKQFVRKDFQLNDTPSLITGLEYNSKTHTLWIGDYYQKVYTWQWNQGITQTWNTQSPVSDFTFYQDNTYITEIGKLFPTELSTGSYSVLKQNSDSALLTLLHRPVNAEIEDLNNDGIAEIVSCNFGNKTGTLSLYTKNHQVYNEQVLMNIPGAIRCYLQDMDGDGRKDIITMFAQGDESVYIMYQKDNLNFKAKRILRFPPHFGTTDMVLVDFDKDGLTDILTAHGDNADHSNVLKAFHGIRIHLNKGNGNFDEKYFYPIYGATKLVAEDFDKDGDVDIALTAFFPDYEKLLEESFVYLENNGKEKAIEFTPHTQKNEIPIKSLTLEKGDIDNDGDIDIFLGLFAQSPAAVPSELDQQWKSSKIGLTIFMNQLY